MKNLFMFALVFAFVGFANAQEKPAKKNNFEEWSTALGLTDTQKAEVKTIEAKYEDLRASMRETGTGKDFRELNQKRQVEINNLLTPEQLKKAEAFKQKKAEEKERKAALKSPTK